MSFKIDAYDDNAVAYAEMVKRREREGIEQEPIMPTLLRELGDVAGLSVLDAGCGEGYLARILAERGARVTGLDISPALIQMAREQDPDDTIAFEVADLCQPLPHSAERFDLAASHFVLDDVYDCQGYLATVASALKPGGRFVLSMNNPYSMVVRGHVHDYFDSGKPVLYRGMADEGIKVHFYYHTLQEYLDACFAAGFQLLRLLDIPTPIQKYRFHSDALIKPGYHCPFYVVLNLLKR